MIKEESLWASEADATAAGLSLLLSLSCYCLVSMMIVLQFYNCFIPVHENLLPYSHVSLKRGFFIPTI